MHAIKSISHFFFGADLWKSRLGIMTATSFLSLLWYVVDWCSFTTFRSMSMWLMWANNILAALLLTIPFLLSRRVWLQTLWMALVDCLLLANIMYCRTYLTDIPLDSFGLVGNLTDFTASIFSSLSLLDLGFPFILCIGAWLASRMPRTKANQSRLRYCCLILLASAVSFTGIALRGGFYKEYNRLVQSCYYSTCGSPVYTFAGHVAYSLLDKKMNADSFTPAEFDNWLAEHETIMPHPALPDSIGRRKNLVVILCESLESWPIGAEVNGKEITPYLNSLVNDSTTFYAPKMLTQVASGRSIDCQLLLFAGMLPMKGAVYSMKYPGSTYLTLNKALRERYGSTSMLFTCDKPITWNQEVISRAFGYDRMFSRRDWVIDELVGNPGKLSDGSFFRQSVEKMKTENIWPEGTPALLTFVTYSGHNPFKLPEALKDADFTPAVNGLHPMLEDYITMAHYTDSQLHTLIEYLQSRSDWPETMVLITGDHEALASWRTEIRKSSDLAAALVDDGNYTPFILLNSPIPGRADTPMGQIDMYPTLLGLLDTDNYPWKGMGQSIFAPNYHATAISSMTNEIVGDTTNIDRTTLNHLMRARAISDGIIRSSHLSAAQGHNSNK